MGAVSIFLWVYLALVVLAVIVLITQLAAAVLPVRKPDTRKVLAWKLVIQLGFFVWVLWLLNTQVG